MQTALAHTALPPCPAVGPPAAVRAAPPLTLIHSRPARVGWLILAIFVLSLADLHMTLDHLTSIGMGEANPIARLIIGVGSPLLLVAWKLASVSAACLAFFAGRRMLLGEIAAWFCCVVMVWLTLQWQAYATELAATSPAVHLLHQADAGMWVTLTP